MKRSFYILIGYCVCILKGVHSVSTNVVNDTEKLEIQELEKQKSEVFIQINEAIEDTINTLRKSNDTDAREGITYMESLRGQIAEFNTTELVRDGDAVRASSEDFGFEEISKLKSENITGSLLSGRRTGSKKEHASDRTDRTGYERIKKTILSFGKFKKGHGSLASSIKKQDKLDNAILLQKKLDDWMAKREAEKARIRKYKERLQSARGTSVTEDCPDFGQDKPKKKKKGGPRQATYPCCRKCCKKSYMGCLKKK